MMHQMLRRIKHVEKYVGIQKENDIRVDGLEFLINNSPFLFYQPVETAKQFHRDDSKVKLIMGPYGSSKTTTCLAEILFRSIRMPEWDNGVRKSKWLIIRNTYGELETTTFQSWIRWFDELGFTHRVKKPVLTYSNRFSDGNGVVEMEIIFLALDKEGDIRKLKSLEVTGAYINEASEIPFGVLEHLKGRVGRYPMIDGLDYWSGIILDTNPPNRKHWIYRVFEEEKPRSHIIYHQPPGLLKNAKGEWQANTKADNFQRLGSDYYLNMANGASEEYIKVYCLGEYGTLLLGKKVFPEYNDDLHSISHLEFNKELPVLMGMDFGLTPCVLFVQVYPNGQVHVLKEITTEFMGLRQFIETHLNPFVQTYLKGYQIGIIEGDPAGESRSQTDEKSCFDILSEYGYSVEGAPTNLITPRLEMVRLYLNRLIDGKPMIVIDRENCEMLREGLLGHYKFKKLRVKDDIYKDEPEKNEYSHIQDALQYVLCSINIMNSKNANDEMASKLVQSGLRF